MGKGCGEGNGGDARKCVEVWDPNTLLIQCRLLAVYGNLRIRRDHAVCAEGRTQYTAISLK